MTKQTEQKINWYEKVSEARVEEVVKEEAKISKESAEIKALKENTWANIKRMEEAAKAGDEELRREIRNEIVVDNMRLVTQVLKKYGFFNQDKFQNGCIGLLKAAETFNSEKGVPFPNYAAFCIETEVRLAFKKVNRAFEGKSEGFLDSLDDPGSLANGDEVDKHETIADPLSESEFDSLIEDAQVDTLFYDIIIPSIELYGTRAKDIDMELWQQLEIQYFIELSMEQSQRQRLTFTEMAKQLDTTPQNIRVRHKKVMDRVRKKCLEFGYEVHKSKTGRTRFVLGDTEQEVKKRGKKHK